MKSVELLCKNKGSLTLKMVNCIPRLASDWQLEDLEVLVADHVQRVMKPNFGASWEEVGPENELEDTYALSSINTLEGT